MRPNARTRGFTLLEMVIALGLTAVVVASAMVLMLSQQRSFRTGSDDRALQEVARIALSRLSADLRSAGYGVDPALVFDFGAMQKVRMKQAPEGAVVNTAGFRCETGPACRDHTDGPDEIVFLSRDPMFGKPLRAAVTSTDDHLTVAGPLNVPLSAGQILQVMCFTDPMTWAYVTVSEDVAASDELSVPIPITVGANYDFPTQNASFASSCFSNFVSTDPPYDPDGPVKNAAKVFKVDRYRYFVQRYGGRPYLMLDRGGPDDHPVLEVISPDVEDIQFSYLFPNAAADQLVGGTEDVRLADDPTAIELAPETGFPAYGDSPTAATETNHQAGNIRAVRVSIVVRSPTPDPNRLSDVTIPAAGNRHALAGDAGYQRLLVETTVAVPNLTARAPSFPTYGAAGAYYNVGGG